ncbi:KH domain protein [Opisthorchis viverrini]|uniref:KH domain protein n=1 Tax=Opisthorchis viverrini TaxID=6198 RepID=A0A1S8WHG3_OPIVI|nr:KH domain protein [Opisthorchis viverrini]
MARRPRVLRTILRQITFTQEHKKPSVLPQKGHADMVRFLLEAGADHEHRTDEMHTALMEAAMEGHVEVARLLLAHGANVNIPQDSFESPLTLAACGGHTELAHLLIGYGADIEEVNDEGYTPLMEASREGHEETVSLLLAVGADVNARTEETQETALTLAACGGFIEVCEMLLNAGADIEVGGVGCSTPLMEAAQEGHLELVRRLLQRGAAVNAVTATGDTALHYAAENGHVKVCKELLDWGAVFGAMTEGGRTPLMKAARIGNLEVVKLFVEHGAPIDQPTSLNDANALSLACSGGHAMVVKYLLQHGADPQYQLRDGSTMLIEAARSGSPAVLRLLLDYPRCLTQPTTQLIANAVPQQLQQQQLQLLQQQVYQPLPNGTPSPVGNTPGMPPPPPLPLPLSVAGGANFETCMDPTHVHLHANQRAISCHTQQHTHPAISLQAPTNLVVPSSSSQPQSHLDAALVNAYAVGWADGAASLVQQHVTLSTSGDTQTSTGSQAICSSTNPLLTHPPGSFLLPATNANFDAAPISQNSIVPKLCSGTAVAPTAFRVATEEISSEFRISQAEAVYRKTTTAANPHPDSTMVSRVATNSAGSLSGSSSTSSESSASSLITGPTIDPNDDIGAGLLQALFQELMSDKDERIRRFEAVMSPYNALRVARSSLNQHPQQPANSAAATAVAMTTNAAAIALSRLVDHQQQQQQLCRHRSTAPDCMNDPRTLRRSTPCTHIPSVELLTKVARSGVCDSTSPMDYPLDNLSTSFAADIAMNQQTLDQTELVESVILGSSTSNTTPILSSCHSSSSALSTPECSASSSMGIADSAGSVANPTTTVARDSSPLTTCEYELDRATDILAPTLDSAYLGGVVDTVGLANAQALFHEAPHMDHELLASYRHYHHPGSHLTCALDASAAAAAVASLGHPTSHAGLHHHHHHPLAVSANGDGLVTPSGLLHVPHQAAALSVDALMSNSASALAYDPSNALSAHSLHQGSLPLAGSRILPMGPTNILTANGASLSSARLLTSSEVPQMTNLANTGEAPTPVNVPSLIDVNACIESSMETALTLACHGGHVELVRLLLERGADREHRDKKSYTPLHTAVYANQRAVVAVLLDYGADIEAQVDRTKDTALSIACSHGALEIVEELLNRGANKEHRNISDYTPLSLAASGGHVEVIQLLLRHGAEINSRTGSKLGISPLMLASMNGHTSAVSLLLEHGSDINAHIETNRNTALTLACFQGRSAVVSLLVERKANIEHRAKTGLTPLMEAASGDYVEVGMILLDHGADVNAAPVPSSRDTALTIAADKGNSKFVNLLLEKGAIVEARNKKGATPLWLASNGGHLEVVQSLIKYNADVNSQDNRKVSCLMAAFRKGHINVVRLLVQHVTQFPSDKDCVRHIKMAVTDKARQDIASRTFGINILKQARTNSVWAPAASWPTDSTLLHSGCLAVGPSRIHPEFSPQTLDFVADVTKLSEYSVVDDSTNDCVDSDPITTDDDSSSVHSLSKVSTSSGCSFGFDLQSHDSIGSNDELAKRCQQCREIIIAAKEKQEGEARKNANCLLEQIEQEEEERAIREAMQAKKRERKRMRRKAKQEKERQGKEAVQTSQSNPTEGNLNVSPSPDGGDQEGADDHSPERHDSTLSQAVRHVRQGSFDSQRSNESNGDVMDEQDASFLGAIAAKLKTSGTRKSVEKIVNTVTESPAHRQSAEREVNTTAASDGKAPLRHSSVTRPAGVDTVPVVPVEPETERSAAAATTEAKREKHRSKKQSQRAAKRAAAEGAQPSDSEKNMDIFGNPQDEDVLSNLPVTSSYYPLTVSANGDVNWNALIESQSAQLSQYLSAGFTTSSNTETNSWTVVLPSGGTRAQKNTTQNRSGGEAADWKTTSSTSGSFKKRLSIPVSRHDIGKVIGQGGAVVSALRTMSGIQIDIESARSDEVTERMVYLKGPVDAVQRTYETIQGLLNGSIAGNDVLLMYAALKKSASTTTSTLGKPIMSACAKINGTATLSLSSGVSKTATASGRGTSSSKPTRRTAKTVTSVACSVPSVVSARSSSSQPSASLHLGRGPTTGLKTPTTLASGTSSNSNNNSTVLCGITTLSSVNGGTIMSTRANAPSATTWSAKVLSSSTSSKGNFASVAAAGLIPHPSKASTKSNETKVSHGASKYAVPNLMSTFPSMTPTTAPVSLLSLNVTPFSTSSQMFPDLALPLSTANESAPDSLDEVSFPPLNPKSTRGSAVTNSCMEKVVTCSSPVDGSTQSITATASGFATSTTEAVSVGHSASLFQDDVLFVSSSVTHPQDIPVVESECIATSTLFKPLTVSPTLVSTTHSSQPPTPVGSGGGVGVGSHSTTCSGTPPTTTTQVRSFARAPGSERSAHQRSTNANLAATTIALGDTYPPSLMSLEVAPCAGIATDTLLITPTKRAISPETQSSEYVHPTISTRFRPDQSEWQESEPPSIAASQPCAPFSEPSFTIDTQTSVELSIAPVVGSCPVTNVALAKTTLRAPDSIRSTGVPDWQLHAGDLNPNSLAFHSSAFQSGNSTVPHQTSVPAMQLGAVEHQSASFMSSAMVSSDYPTDALPTGLETTLSGGIRQPASLKSTSAAVQQQPTVQLSSLSTACVSTSGTMLTSTFAQNATVTTVSRSKPSLPVNPNAYAELRNSFINGLSSTVHSQQQVPSASLSTLLPGTHFHQIFSSSHQQQTANSANLSTPLLQQQHAGATSTAHLTGTSHPLFNQAQLAMSCPTVSAPNSYTPPPCIPTFMPPGTPGSGSSYSSHLLNGGGPAVPMGSGSLLGNNSGVHQPPTVPIQPIGAERRRQTASNAVAVPLTGVYPTSTTNGPYSFSSSSLNNPTTALHPQAPSPQQSSNQNFLISMTSSFSGPVGSTTTIPPGKLAAGGMDLSAYNNTNLLQNSLSSGTSSVGNQQQQLVAAMAAIGMCPPWNNTGSTNPTLLNPAASTVPRSSGPTGQGRWLYSPQNTTTYPSTSPSTQSYYSDQLPQPLKPTGNVPHPVAPSHSQAVHRAPQE